MSFCISDSVFVIDWLKVLISAMERSAASLMTLREAITALVTQNEAFSSQLRGSCPTKVVTSSPSDRNAAVDDVVASS